MKEKCMFWLYLFLVISFRICQSSVWRSFKRNVDLDGNNCSVNDSAFEQIYVRGLSGCAARCGRSTICLSIFYDPATFRCFGCKFWYAVNEADGVLPGSIYYEKNVCPKGTDGIGIKRQRSCYFAGSMGLTFDQSVVYCEENNAHIVQAETSEENTFLKTYFQTLPLKGYNVWLGLTDKREEGIWEWYTTGEPTSFSDWGGSEASHKTWENCAFFGIRSGIKWGDISCSNTNTFTLCEKRIDE